MKMERSDTKYILGLKINTMTSKEILDTIRGFLLSDSQHHIVTLNPEMVVEAQSNRNFMGIINHADFCVADGTGIVIADKILNGRKRIERITGIDLIHKICGSAFIKNRRIFLLGAGKGIAERAASVLRNRYPGLNIVGAEEGIPKEITNDPPFPSASGFGEASKLQMTNEFSISNIQYPILDYDKINNALIERINDAKPDVLFVAFGAPKQEMWIYENIKNIPSVRLAIGVGGSFDFISGKIKRAPRIMQKFGLEWLWRLVREPRRIKRIYNATIKFGWMVLKYKKRKGT